MRIHSSSDDRSGQVQSVPPSTLGPSWQVLGSGIRPVLIRHWPIPGAVAAISRRGGPLRDGRRDWSPHVTHSTIADLFLVEQDARMEFTHRRVPRPAPEPFPLIDCVLVGFALGCAVIMGAI